MEQWFGEPWPTADRRAPVCADDRLRIDTPVGEPCDWCDEPVVAGDRGYRMTAGALRVDAATRLPVEAHTETVVIHAECRLRDALGPPAHVTEQCSCYRPDDENAADVDLDLGMDRRAAARFIWDRVMALEARQWMDSVSDEARRERALAAAAKMHGDQDDGIRKAALWN